MPSEYLYLFHRFPKLEDVIEKFHTESEGWPQRKEEQRKIIMINVWATNAKDCSSCLYIHGSNGRSKWWVRLKQDENHHSGFQSFPTVFASSKASYFPGNFQRKLSWETCVRLYFLKDAINLAGVESWLFLHAQVNPRKFVLKEEF